jgi:hypothetical protein
MKKKTEDGIDLLHENMRGVEVPGKYRTSITVV